MRIVVTGGGTGGHVTPTLALCAALQARAKSSQLHLDYIGSGDSNERRLVEAAGLTYTGLTTGKFRRYGRHVLVELSDFKTVSANARDLGRFMRARSRARKLLQALMPDLVFVKGGFVGLPVGLAAHQLGIPLVIHESDVSMGLANRMLARRAQIIATGFPLKSFDHLKTNADLVHTGNPIRQEVLTGSVRQAHKILKIPNNKPAILIIGGSQGARLINQVVWQSLTSLTSQATVLHIAGERWLHDAQAIRRQLTPVQRQHYHPYGFVGTDILKSLYAVSEVAVSRCGANVLTELGLLKKAVIGIPLESSANNHQSANATFLARQGGLRVMRETELTAQELGRAVAELLGNDRDRIELGRHLYATTAPQAADRLARIIIDYIKTRQHVK